MPGGLSVELRDKRGSVNEAARSPVGRSDGKRRKKKGIEWFWLNKEA